MQRMPRVEENKEREEIKKSRRSSTCGNATKDIARGEAGMSH